MTLQWIPLDALQPHPENSNRMSAALMEKLKGHISRTGRYEPLVVRPVQCEMRSAECGMKESRCVTPNADSSTTALAEAERETETDQPAASASSPLTSHPVLHTPHYQILNGHHRAEVLRQLGHSHARCDVWEVDDGEARLLLATLNRLEGRDDPAARARLVAHLAGSQPAADLADLLPEPADAVERLLALARPPAAPLPPEQVEPPLRPMMFFLGEEQHALVSEALGEIAKRGVRNAECGVDNETAKNMQGLVSRPACGTRLPRGEALERLAQWYLESRRLR
jgi:hypothetical protein